MNRLAGLLNTSIGQKLVLGVSGFALVGFLLVHMLGNLTIYQGREMMNSYASWLQGHPLLWIARSSLIIVFLIHTSLALRLAWSNYQARPIGYTHRRRNLETTMLSRYIVLTGLLVFAFVVYHLLHFTLGAVQPEYARLLDDKGQHDVYGMVVRSFRVPAVAASYVVAMVVLGFHLLHGLTSLCQTLGLFHVTYNGAIRLAVWSLVLLIIVGNASIPLSIWLGLINS